MTKPGQIQIDAGITEDQLDATIMIAQAILETTATAFDEVADSAFTGAQVARGLRESAEEFGPRARAARAAAVTNNDPQ